MIALGLFLGDGMIALMEVCLPLYLSAVMNFSPGIIGLIYAINPLLYATCVPIFGLIHSKWGNLIGGRWTLIFISLWAMGIGYLGSFSSYLLSPSAALMLIVRHTAWLIGWWCLMGIGMAGVDACSNPELADIGDKRFSDSYGRIYAVGNTAATLGFIVGPLFGTSLVASVAFFKTFLITGLILVAFAPFLFSRKIWSRTHSQLPVGGTLETTLESEQ